MSVNLLGERQLRRARRVSGDPLVDRGLVWSHHESGRFVLLITSDHRHLVWDRETDEVEPEEPPLTELSSCYDRFGPNCHQVVS